MTLFPLSKKSRIALVFAALFAIAAGSASAQTVLAADDVNVENVMGYVKDKYTIKSVDFSAQKLVLTDDSTTLSLRFDADRGILYIFGWWSLGDVSEYDEAELIDYCNKWNVKKVMSRLSYDGSDDQPAFCLDAWIIYKNGMIVENLLENLEWLFEIADDL